MLLLAHHSCRECFPNPSLPLSALLSSSSPQACHSHVNFTFSQMDKEEKNPFEPGSVHVP